ncbi:hypothetical protein SynROS8604_02367 [Synechococcus sp. ROS8604]|nr:hypothetical protein SynROS8604_02367 [Synechococcus sp. ROS8604]
MNESTKAQKRSNECSQLAINNISMKSQRSQGQYNIIKSL